MTTLGSLSLFLQTSSNGGSALLQRRASFQPRPLCEPKGNLPKMRSFGVGKTGSLVGFGYIGREKEGKGVRAGGKSGYIKGGDDRVEEGEDVADEALQATITQSKKVLALQKDLLKQVVERRKLVSSIKSSAADAEQDAVVERRKLVSSIKSSAADAEQDAVVERRKLVSSIKSSAADAEQDAVVERRKLVSSIKSSAADAEQDAVSSNESAGSFSNIKQISIDGELDKKYSSSTITNKSIQLTEVDTSINGHVGDGRQSLYEKEVETSEQAIHAIADALELVRESSLEAAQPEIISPSISQISGSYNVINEKIDDSKDDVGGASDEHDAASDEGDTDIPLAGENVMNVIVVAAECAPWSQTGGLGDVSGALAKALARRGHRVMVVVPRYENYSEPQDLGVRKIYKVDGQDMEVCYYHAFIDGVDFIFLDSANFRHRGNDIYGGNRVDILKRMVLLCKAAVEVPWHVPCGGSCYGDGNLVFIANDWHTALLPVYLKAYYRDHGQMTYTRCVLVIHNIAHQGRGPLEDFAFMDLPGHYIDSGKHYDPIGGGHFNIFAAGLKNADRVVTVSHGYSWELKTSEGGWGLDGIINENDWKFQGIVNGIDTNDWNPKLDEYLKSDGYANYSVETLQVGKAQCKAALQKELGFPVRPEVPVIAFIGRLDYQKGIDLIADAMHWIAGGDVQLVMLGAGRQDLEEMLKKFESQHQHRVRGWVGFSVKMAHRITAGADILLMPSRFEPCGLNQLYAMMYGTVPVVHAVGGLRDTVRQFDPLSETGFGWTFDKAESNRMIDALANCLKTYWHHKSSWEGLQRRGMMQDLSWDKAAQQYEEVLVAAKYQW